MLKLSLCSPFGRRCCRSWPVEFGRLRDLQLCAASPSARRPRFIRGSVSRTRGRPRRPADSLAGRLCAARAKRDKRLSGPTFAKRLNAYV